MPTLSVVVPATDAPETLGECIRAIEDATASPEEVHVIDTPQGAGPAAARNIGARLATGDVLVFVDSDVAVHPDTFSQIRTAFSSDPTLSALFGSYDDDPRASGLVSTFRNLLHHHVHHSAAGPATTFWAGLGAIRRADFLKIGGFDEKSFPRPSIEDIELGTRLARQGSRIILDAGIQGKHLKRWTLRNMILTDFDARGAPWVALLLGQRSRSTALNLGWRHRSTAAASLALAVATVRGRPKVAATLLVSIVVLNQSFYRMLLRRRGVAFTAAALPLHVVHHLVGVAAVPEGARRYLRRRRSS